MKKLVVTILLLCYVANVFGFSISLNYCNEKLSGVTVNYTSILWCCEDGADGDGCCDSELIKVQKADNHFRSTLNLEGTDIDVDLPVSYYNHYAPKYAYEALIVKYFAPPTSGIAATQSPLYLLYSVFRI